MDSRRRRSSLRKSLAADTVSSEIKSVQKRRISFSGKKSVRIFSGEEEPKAWNNSFEISDHLNVNETTTNLYVPSKIGDLQNSQANKISIRDGETAQKDACHQQNNLTNLSINNLSDQRMSNDFINVTDQIPRNCRIENSIDITLIEDEKRFQKEVICNDQTNSNLLSFSLEDNERKGQFGEKTYDFMQDLEKNTIIKEEGVKICVASHRKEEAQIPTRCFATFKNISVKDSAKCYKSGSLSTKSEVQVCEKNDVSRKSVYEVSTMQLTFNEAQQLDKENINPLLIQKVNETQNSSYQMEIEESSNKTKLVPTIYFDQQIQNSTIRTINISTKQLVENVAFENEKTLRSSIYYNQAIDTDAQTTTTNGDHISKGAIPKVKSSSLVFKNTVETRSTSLDTKLHRKTMNLNDDIDKTSYASLIQVSEPYPTSLDTKLSRKTMELNEDMIISSHDALSTDSAPCASSPHTNFSRKTINLNDDMDTSHGTLLQDAVPQPTSLSTKLCRKTMNLNDDMNITSYSALLQETARYPTSLVTKLSKKTVNLNEDMDTTSHGTLSQVAKPGPTSLATKLCRKTMNLNENMDMTSHGPLSPDAVPCPSRSRNNEINDDMDTSSGTLLLDAVSHSTNLNTKLCRKTMNLDEDMNITSQGTLSQESVTCPTNVSTKLCTKTVNLNADTDTISHGTLSQDSEPGPTSLGTKLFRKTMNLNEDMDITSHGPLSPDSVPSSSSLRNNFSRKTMNLNDDMNITSNSTLSQETAGCPASLTTKLCTKTMNFHEDMDTTSHGTLTQASEPGPTSLFTKLCRKTVNFNADMDTTSHGALSQASELGPASLDTKLCRKIMNLNENMYTTSHDATSLQDSVPCRTSLDTKLYRKTTNLNEDMDMTSHGPVSPDSVPCPSSSRDGCSRKTINLGENIDTTSNGVLPQESVFCPASLGTKLYRKTMNLNEDMDMTSHCKLSEDSDSCKNLSISKSSQNIRKNQPAKIIFRKICLPTPNKEKRLFDSRPRKMMQLEKEQQKNGQADSNPESAAISVKKDDRKKVNKSLNFSIESLKNCSMVSENSSPLIPLEYKGYTLKQLNDEIESGRIKVFPNVQKTPIINRLKCNIKSTFLPDNESLTLSPILQRKSLLLEDVNIPTTSNKAKYRYSQADEIMLDNTSFLARAKLSDETVSHKSSKRDSTQFNDTMDIFDESLTAAADQPENCIYLSLQMKNMCNQDNTISSMRQRTQPILTPEVTNINNSQNSINMMDISNEHEHENDIPSNTLPLLQRTKECQKTFTQVQLDSANKENIPVPKTDNSCYSTTTRGTLYCSQRIPLEKTLLETQDNDKALVRNTNFDSRNSNPSRKTLYYNHESVIGDNDLVGNSEVASNPSANTLYFNKDISFNVDPENNVQPCITQSPSRKTLLFATNIQEDSNSKDTSIRVESFNKDTRNLALTRKTLFYNNEIPSEKEITNKSERFFTNNKAPAEELLAKVEENKQTDVGSLPEPTRKTLFVVTDMQEESIIKDDQNTNAASCNFNPSRKTVYYNNEIPLEILLTETQKNSTLQEEKEEEHNLSKACMPLENATEKICLQSELNAANCDNEKYPRKTIYFNSEIHSLEIPKQTIDKTNNSCEENEELMDLTLGNLDANKTRTFQSKLLARRNSVYTPENMDLTMDDEVFSKHETSKKQELGNQEQISDVIADETKYEHEKFETKSNEISSAESKDCREVGEIDQSFMPAETYQFPEPEPAPAPAASMNAAKMALSRRFAKNTFVTPKKSAAMGKSFSLCITPRLSLLEFERLEKEQREEREINGKRLAVNLTPILSITKKKHTLNFDDCLQNVVEQTKESEEPQCADKSILSEVDADESVLQTPLREKKSRIPIPINSSIKMQKSYSLIEADNYTQNENDVQLETENNDNFTESIQVMRRATTFTNREDTISEQHNNLQPHKPSIFEGNPITISDVSVFFETQRKSHIDCTTVETSLPLEAPNSFVLQPVEKPKTNLESRFINLTLEDIDKTHLSLVSGSEDYDKDDSASVNVFKGEDQNIKERSLEKHATNNESTLEKKRPRKNFENLLNVSLVCRKCKRCQETFVNETTSSTTESFVLPELPPIPDLGLERLRRLRKRPSIADVNMLWQRVSLNRTIYNTNISDKDMESMFDFDDETENKNSVVSKFIQTFYENKRSYEMKFLENPQKSATSSERLPFALRLDDLLRKNCTNWTFDYQSQFRGILLFTHKKLYTFTLVVTFDAVDPLGHKINLKSVKLEKGHHMPKKNWKPIDFVLEFQLKLNLPFDIQRLCKGSSESDVLQMLQEIDGACLKTLKSANDLQLICYSNQASILSYTGGSGTYVRKVFRQIVNRPNTDLKYVKKTEIQVELLNLENLSFKDITFPQLHHFREEVHLLPTGLQFLAEFLPNVLLYLKDS